MTNHHPSKPTNAENGEPSVECVLSDEAPTHRFHWPSRSDAPQSPADPSPERDGATPSGAPASAPPASGLEALWREATGDLTGPWLGPDADGVMPGTDSLALAPSERPSAPPASRSSTVLPPPLPRARRAPGGKPLPPPPGPWSLPTSARPLPPPKVSTRPASGPSCAPSVRPASALLAVRALGGGVRSLPPPSAPPRRPSSAPPRPRTIPPRRVLPGASAPRPPSTVRDEVATAASDDWYQASLEPALLAAPSVPTAPLPTHAAAPSPSSLEPLALGAVDDDELDRELRRASRRRRLAWVGPIAVALLGIGGALLVAALGAPLPASRGDGDGVVAGAGVAGTSPALAEPSPPFARDSATPALALERAASQGDAHPSQAFALRRDAPAPLRLAREGASPRPALAPAAADASPSVSGAAGPVGASDALGQGANDGAAAPAPRPFDPAAAARALTGAVAAAAATCRSTDDGPAVAHVTVTFAPSGHATRALVTGGAWQGTRVGSCLAQALKAARVSPFDGELVTVSKTVSL
jgi:hypothetical protein